MSVLPSIHALCETIRHRVTIPVVLGRPDSAIPGLYIWPWRMEINAEWSSRPPRPPMGGEDAVGRPTFNTHILILPIPALSAEGWTSLETAQLALHDHPMLTVNGTVLRIVPEATFSVEELSALFVAAQLPLSICAAFVLSGPSLPVA